MAFCHNGNINPVFRETTENPNHNSVLYSTASWRITYSFKKAKAKFSVPYGVQPEDEIVNNLEGSFNTETNISNHQAIGSKVGF